MRIAAYRGRSFLSWLIKLQTRSHYSHIAILNHDGTVFESWQRGGVLHNSSLSIKHTPKTPVDLFNFVTPLTNAQERNMREEAKRHLGKAYDFRSVLRFISRRNAAEDTSRKLFCSQYAFMICLAGGIELLSRTPPDRVPPDWIPRSPLLVYSGTVITI